MAFRDWAWWKWLFICIGIIGILWVGYLFIRQMTAKLQNTSEVVINGKTYQLLPIAVLSKPEEYLLDEDILKDKSGKVIAIKYEALQRISEAQPFTLADLARMFELLAGDEDTLEARSTRQSFTSLTKKTLLADKDLTEKLRGQPGRTGNVGIAGKDAKADKAEIRSVVQQVLASQPVKKETVPVVIDHTQEIAGLRADLEVEKAKLAELKRRFDELTVTKRIKVTGDAKIRIGGEE